MRPLTSLPNGSVPSSATWTDSDALPATLAYDAAQRSADKQSSRDADYFALSTGATTRDQLRRENGLLWGFRFRIHLAGAKSLA